MRSYKVRSLNFRESVKMEVCPDIHSYTARMIPQIARHFIETYSRKNELVLDPFCGSGTVLLEAKMLGRNTIGIDINPLAVLISEVKTTSIEHNQIKNASEADGIKLKVIWVSRERNLADPVCHKAFIQDVEARAEEKAKKQFQNYAIRQEGNVFVVWKNGNVSYQVSFAPLSCTCPAFRRWKNYPLLKRSNIVLRCKHHFIIEFLTKGIENAS